MITVTIEEVQRDLSSYLRRVRAGEVVTVIDDHQPIAEIRPVRAAAGQRRPSALCAGEFTIPDEFEAPLPDDILFESR